MKYIRIINRNHRDFIVLIPGWATDYRIFNTLELKFNYILLEQVPFRNLDKELLGISKRYNIKEFSILGWSLGGFIAADFASRHLDLIERLMLVGIREGYPKEQIDYARTCLEKNKKAYLYSFYNRCFHKKEEFTMFKNHLLMDYYRKFTIRNLFNGLDYLEKNRINTKKLKDIKDVAILHGKKDCIAPIEEAVDIKNKLPQAKFIGIDEAGHMPFLNKAFSKALCSIKKQ